MILRGAESGIDYSRNQESLNGLKSIRQARWARSVRILIIIHFTLLYFQWLIFIDYLVLHVRIDRFVTSRLITLEIRCSPCQFNPGNTLGCSEEILWKWDWESSCRQPGPLPALGVWCLCPAKALDPCKKVGILTKSGKGHSNSSRFCFEALRRWYFIMDVIISLIFLCNSNSFKSFIF